MAQIVLFRLQESDTKYLPKDKAQITENKWDNAKHMLAKVLQMTSRETERTSLKWLTDRMVSCDIPAVPNGYTNAITCIANSGEHSKGKGNFTALDFEGHTYLYETDGGGFCIANIPDDGATEYYRIAVMEDIENHYWELTFMTNGVIRLGKGFPVGTWKKVDVWAELNATDGKDASGNKLPHYRYEISLNNGYHHRFCHTKTDAHKLAWVKIVELGLVKKG